MTTIPAFPLRATAIGFEARRRAASRQAVFAAGLLVLAVAFSLGGCASTDPLSPERQGLWRPNHANEANLAAMVANPADLRRGESEPGSDAILAAAAVHRLHHDQVKQLPDSNVVQIGSSGGGGSSGGAGASLSGGE